VPIAPHIKRLRDAVGHELLTLPSVSAIVFDEANRILMVQSADDGSWTTPGGAVDPNEHPADAVIRELWEETGLVARPVRLLGVFGGPESVVAYQNGDRTNYVNTVL
jgi:8-oxo-dGTP pyrophosphatase MutT (NUDIX family)